MSLTSSRVLLSTRSVSRSRRGASLLVAAALLLTLGACATLAHGADPVVVRTEQALEVSLAVYDAGMTWCESHPQMLTADAAKAAETIRTGFPPVYRATDSGLQLYKAGKGAAPNPGELNRLVAQLVELVRLAGGPDLTGAKKTSDVRLMRHEAPFASYSIVQVPGPPLNLPVRLPSIKGTGHYFDGCNWCWTSDGVTSACTTLYCGGSLPKSVTNEWRVGPLGGAR